MKKTFFTFLALAIVFGSYILGSFNARKVIEAPPASWAENSQSATAWRELVTAMEAAGAEVFSSSKTKKDQLDGLLYLSQLISLSLEMKLSKGNVAEPKFTNWMADYRKFLGDSPDAVYHTADISPQYSYEITGNIGGAEYLAFMLYGKSINGWNRAADNLSNKDISIDEKGNFKLLLSSKKPDDSNIDWLPLESDIHMLMARQYFHDRSSQEEASFSIRNLNPSPFKQPDDANIATGIQNATTFFYNTLNGSKALSTMLSQSPNNPDPPKGYSQDFGGIFYPTYDNEYFGSWFSIEDDEALIIEGEVPEAPYWSVSLQNRWMQSFDYVHYQTSLNDKRIKTANGRYRIIVSQQQPKAGNWINTAGYNEGILSIRYQLATKSSKPTFTVVKFDQL